MSASGCPQTVLFPNGDEPVRVRPAVLRLTFHAMVIGLYECSHISMGCLVVLWEWACMSAAGCH